MEIHGRNRKRPLNGGEEGVRHHEDGGMMGGEDRGMGYSGASGSEGWFVVREDKPEKVVLPQAARTLVVEWWDRAKNMTAAETEAGVAEADAGVEALVGAGAGVEAKGDVRAGVGKGEGARPGPEPGQDIEENA